MTPTSIPGRLARYGGIAVASIAAVFAVFLVFSRVMAEPESRGYVMRRPGGEVVIGYRTCRGQYISRIVVKDADHSDHVFWTIERHGYTDTRQIPLGKVPVGFREKVAFQKPSPTQKIDIEVRDSDGVVSATEFRLQDLKAGYYVMDADSPKQEPISSLQTTGTKKYGCYKD
jgi:hypothetical protein